MKKYLSISISHQLSVICLIVSVGIIFNSCSKLQNSVLSPVQSQSQSGIYPHPVGWSDSASSNFHGAYFINTYISTHNLDLASCASCHGNDLKGGMTKVSCYSCHQGSDGTLACNTCHGSFLNPAPPKDLSGNSSVASPTVGAHQDHLSGNSLAPGVACSSCHAVPQAAGPAMHPTVGNVLVIFSGVATTETNTPGSQYYDSTQSAIIPVPTFNFETLQCSNTYCHGNFKNGDNFTPTWKSGDSTQAACGTCHGIPPNTAIHQAAFYQGPSAQDCYFCHEPMMGQNGIQDSSLHVNGELELYGKSLVTW